MELDKNLEMYVNDLETQEIFGKWAEKIAEDKGKEQGYEQGSLEEKNNIAREMLSKKLDTKLISECTGLSITEIESLK